MGAIKELDITYQQIVEAYVLSDYTINAERRIWDEIGTVHPYLADGLTDVYQYEAALWAIENNMIPHNNAAWQQIVIRLAYNALTDLEEFKYFLQYSNRTVEEVQRLIDTAMFVILGNRNFKLDTFQKLIA